MRTVSHNTNNLAITGTNLERARARNRRVVLEAIRQAGQLTRAELSRLTALTPQTISSIAAELLDDGTLLAHAPASIPRGQPPVPLSLNPNGAFSIGFYIDDHQITGVLADFLGAVRARHTLEVDRADATAISSSLVDAVHTLREPAAGRPVMGIGISVGTSRLLRNAGRAPNGQSMSGWDDAQSLAELEARVEAPVRVETPTIAAVMGERLYGPATTSRSFVYLFVGKALSAGLYLGGHVYDGARHRAGQIGHMTVVPGGRLCPCGKQGCLQQYVSGESLLRCLGSNPNTWPTLPEVASAKSRQHFEDWLAEAAPALHQAVDVIEQLLDPELVLLGGTLPVAVLQPLLERAFPSATACGTHDVAPRAQLALGNAGTENIARGAAAAIILAALSPDHTHASPGSPR